MSADPTIPPAHLPPPAADETLDRLLGDWWVYQLAKGHRFSTDDLVCGWRAAQARPDAKRLLDLGSGIGSVGLYTLGLLERGGARDASLVGVEAQEVSHRLAVRSVAANGLRDRVRMLHGDLRRLDEVLDPDARFDLITGSPPYIPLGKGVVSPHPQRAACRMELRGSVFDYARAAAPRLAPDGRYVFVMSGRDPRTDAAPVEAGLAVLERLEIVFRAGDAPMLAVLVCARPEDGPHPDRVVRTLQIREAEGRHTEAYRSLRRSRGFRDEPVGQ